MPWPVAGRVASSPLRPSRHGAIVNLAVVLQLVAAALPPGAEDEIVLIEHLPGRQVHLQDFFWTGLEDAPAWMSSNQLLYETRTVHHHHTATVYAPDEETGTRPLPEGPRPLDCPSCPIEPTPTLLHEVDQDIGVLVGEDPGPRYWLLTVLKPGEDVPPKIELRLARLYKAAFMRQQQRHLGLLPEYRTRKSFPKRQILSENQTMIAESTEASSSVENSSPAVRQARLGRSLLHMRPVRIIKGRRTLPLLDGGEFQAGSLSSPVSESGNETGKSRLRSPVDIGIVQVRMQNTSLTEAGAARLIYTVHLGGKPVPAETAAKDMALLSAQEVALELGAPVIVQSEPLSRKRDAWLLFGAAGAGVLLLAFVLAGLLVFTKRKRAQSAVAAPPARAVLAKDVEEYAPTTPGIDNTAYTSETEARTEATSGRKRTTPGTLSRTPGSQDTLEADQRDAMISENELEPEQHRRGQQPAKIWDTREYAEAAKRGAPGRRAAMQRSDAVTAAIDRPRSLESPDSAVGGDGRMESLESLEKGFGPEEATGSPHSYLSMPSCKQFPNMRSVEPLSKVLEPVVVKHLDVELDSPDVKIKSYDYAKRNGGYCLSRAASEMKDPGVLGPIVWDLKRRRAEEAERYAAAAAAAQADEDLEPGRLAYAGPVGRARRRLNGLIEDSLGLFGSRESRRGSEDEQRQQPEQRRAPVAGAHQDPGYALLAETRGRSANVSPVATPSSAGALRPHTSLPRGDPSIPETGQSGPQARGAWGSRPLSAGPFHRPNPPEVEVARVLADQQLRPEDPAVPLIAAIRKELGKFSY